MTTPADVTAALEGVTPGPWSVDKDGIISTPGSRPRVPLASPWIEGAWAGEDATPESTANARFIAWCREGVPSLAAALAEQTRIKEAAEARVVDLTAKMQAAPVQVDAAHIRAEALREAAAVARSMDTKNDDADLSHNLTVLRLEAAILALIPTPAPSPDVGALAEAISVQTRLIRAGCGGQQNRLDICCDRIDAALAKMKGGAARALASQEGGE